MTFDPRRGIIENGGIVIRAYWKSANSNRIKKIQLDCVVMYDIWRKDHKTLADESAMIRYQSQNQLSIEESRTAFELQLSRGNR